MTLTDYFEYACFADLAYVRWRDAARIAANPLETTPEALIEAADANERIPGRIGVPSLGSSLFGTTSNGANWQLAAFFPNDPATGFAASFFTNAHDGRRILAIRGTEEIYRDLIQADLQEIGGLGLALSQCVSMVNTIQRLCADAGATTTRLELRFGAFAPDGVASVATDSGCYWLEAHDDALGLGLVAPGERFSVTGHSLGGHLAALAQRLFPDRIETAVTFNAPGYDARLGLEDKFELSTVLASLDAGPSLSTALDLIVNRGQQLTNACINTLFAPYLESPPAADFASLEAAGRLFSLVSESQGGGDDAALVSSALITGEPASTRLEVTTEVNSHSMSQLVDALGLQRLLARLNPDLDLAGAAVLIRAASPDPGRSQEVLADALGTLLLADGASPLETAVPPLAIYLLDPPEPFAARAAYHERLVAISAALDTRPDLYLESLVDPASGRITLSVDELVGRARGELAYRYALHALNPFVLRGDDTVYTLGNRTAELAVEHFSAEYLTDRARFLGFRVAAASLDTPLLIDPDGYHARYVDTDSHLELTTLQAVALDPRQTHYIFGGAAADELHGHDGEDHLYGDAGDDDLLALDGTDLLEGGAGSDRLQGGHGRDLLRGDDGDDTLYGNGLDNLDDLAPDRLEGGRGADRYFVGDGDVVFDIDAQGAVYLGADSLCASGSYYRVATAVYRHAEQDITIYLQGTDAIVVAFGLPQTPRVRLANVVDPTAGFLPGTLGITLFDEPPTTTPDGTNLNGTATADRLAGTAGDDVISGLDGNDELFGGSAFGPWGADRLLGGDGDDYLDSRSPLDIGSVAQTTGEQGDYFDGGPGNDVLVGDAGADQQYGDSGQDFLAGRGGADVLLGGRGDDVLAGGGGDDLLVGGSGNDVLFGALDAWATVAGNWSVAPLVNDDGVSVDVWFTGILLGTNPPPDDADTLYGETGADLLNGGNGNDLLDGGDDDDVLLGWRGDDRLLGGSGADVLYGDCAGLATPAEGGADDLHGGDGDDRLFGEAGNDRLAGGAGGDQLQGGSGSDRLDGGAGDDRLDGGSGDDHLLGGAGADILHGGADTDLLEGGPGDDLLFGDLGHDVYRYRPGDGHDSITDSGGYDIVIIEGVDDLSSVTRVQDTDGLCLQFDADNSLTLQAWGNGGVDQILCGSLILLAAGTVEDHHFLNAFEVPQALLFDPAQGTNLLRADGSNRPLLVDAALGDAAFSALVDSEGTWHGTAGSVELVIPDWRSNLLSAVFFSDGAVLDRMDIAAATAYAPRLLNPLPDQRATAGFALGFQLPAGAFFDPDGTVLGYSASLENGAALPDWLSFDPSTRAFSGIPGSADAGSYTLRVTAEDPEGHALSDSFTLRVTALRFDHASAFDPGSLNGSQGFWLTHNPDAAGQSYSAGTLRSVRDACGVGDINGDGRDDLLVSETWANGSRRTNRHFVVFGQDRASTTLLDPAARVAAGQGLEIEAPGGNFAVTAADLDGDGYQDLVFSPYGYSAADHYVLYGDATLGGVIDIAALPAGQGAQINGPGISATGDYNGDGFTDLLLWRTVLLGGPERPEGAINTQTLTPAQGFSFSATAGLAGRPLDALDPIGDFNGDGTPDFLAVDYSGARFHVVLGPPGTVSASFDLDYTHRIRLDGNLRRLGQTQVGDFNHDGLSDIILIGGNGPGAYNDLRIVFGNADPDVVAIDTDTLDGRDGCALTGFWSVDGIGGGDHGNHVVTVGDINGDGIDDIGLSESAYLTVPGNGYIPCITGREGDFPAAIRLAELDAADGFYAMVPDLAVRNQRTARALAAGDFDGDGTNDLLVHYAGDGSAYLALGTSDLARTVLVGTPADDIIDALGPGTLVQAFDGNDRITVRSAFGSVVRTGGGNNDIHLLGEVLVGDIPLGRSTIEHARENPIIIIGGAGADRIVVESRPLVLHFSDPSGPVGNSLAFGDGYDPAALHLDTGSLLLRFGPDQAEVHLEDFDPLDVLGGPRSIESVAFADGTSLTYEELVAQGFDIDGSANGDSLSGTNLVDRISGLAGNDVLTGHTGNDRLDGGAGDDVYCFAPGDGHDRLRDSAGIDTIRWDAGITLADLTVSRVADDLIVTLSSADSLTLEDWFTESDGTIEWLEFADGSRIASATLVNRPPAALPLPDQILLEDQPWALAAGASAFSDPDANDYLTFRATWLHDASAAPGLPLWLTFDAESGTFSGTPGNEDVGAYRLSVTATDRAGASATSAVSLEVVNVNDPPVLMIPPSPQTAVEAQPFLFTLDPLTFHDEDLGDVLSLTAGLSDAAPLPAWLRFDPATGSLSGTPQAADLGVKTIVITATDLTGDSADAVFTLDTIAAFHTFTGTPADDVITGTIAVDFINGGAGDDVITGLAGDDRIEAGDGNDTVDAGSGNNRVFGEDGDDYLLAGDGHDDLDGGDGDDLIVGGGGDDWLRGGDGRDHLYGGAGNDVVEGGADDDALFGLNGDDRLSGDGGDDWIVAGEGNNRADGGSGDDRLYGGSGHDTLYGDAGDDLLLAGSGDDTLDGGSGDDYLDGGPGEDLLLGGSGNDRYRFQRGDGCDVLIERSGGDDSVTIADSTIEHADLWFTRRGDDLVIDLIDSADRLTIRDWYATPSARVESLVLSDGYSIDAFGMEQLVQAMAAFTPASGADTPLTFVAQAVMEPVLAANWQVG